MEGEALRRGAREGGEVVGLSDFAGGGEVGSGGWGGAGEIDGAIGVGVDGAVGVGGSGERGSAAGGADEGRGAGIGRFPRVARGAFKLGKHDLFAISPRWSGNATEKWQVGYGGVQIVRGSGSGVGSGGWPVDLVFRERLRVYQGKGDFGRFEGIPSSVRRSLRTWASLLLSQRLTASMSTPAFWMD